MQEGLPFAAAVHLRRFNLALVHIAQGGNVQHDGLADGGGK